MVDINECAEESDGCAHLCTNTISSYYCTCYNDGYALQSDEHDCQGKLNFVINLCQSFIPDINECLSNNGGCDQTCTNSIGSYSCSCNIGFVLAPNEHSCYGKLCHK